MHIDVAKCHACHAECTLMSCVNKLCVCVMWEEVVCVRKSCVRGELYVSNLFVCVSVQSE